MRCKKELSSIDRFNAAFPSNLRSLLKEKDVTQQELADSIGKSRPVVGSYANGVASPDLDTLVRIARFFSVSTDYLLGESRYTNPDVAKLTVEDMGLSERATNALINLAQSGDSISMNKISALNLMLEDDDAKGVGTQLLSYIADYFSAPEVLDQMIQFTCNKVEILDLDSTIAKNLPPNCVSAHMLYDRALIDQVILALDGTRTQFRFSPIANDVYKEEPEHGIPKT